MTGRAAVRRDAELLALKLIRRMDNFPKLLLRLTKYGLEPVTVEETDHYRVMREFCDDPATFVEAAIAE